MALRQAQPIKPPVTEDKGLIDFAEVIQRSFTLLFQDGHAHVGAQGILTVNPKSTDGDVGDILIGNISGSIYLFFKVTTNTWYRLGPATKV
jgi:hypothetical protein